MTETRLDVAKRWVAEEWEAELINEGIPFADDSLTERAMDMLADLDECADAEHDDCLALIKEREQDIERLRDRIAVNDATNERLRADNERLRARIRAIDSLDIYYPAGVEGFDDDSEWYRREDVLAALREEATDEYE